MFKVICAAIVVMGTGFFRFANAAFNSDPVNLLGQKLLNGELTDDDYSSNHREVYLTNYAIDGFNIEKSIQNINLEFNEVEDDENQSPCRYNVSNSFSDALAILRANDGQVMKEFQKINLSNLNATIAVDWDGQSGESESCSYSKIYVYSKGGSLLEISYDFRD